MDWDGDGRANELDEWIELYNAGSEPTDLSGWLLQAAANEIGYRIPDGTLLDRNAFLVLYRKETGIVLEDGGGTVRLLEASGQLVDAVTFGAVGADANYYRSEAGPWFIGRLPSPGAPNVELIP
jgi:hypothetical protein